MRWARRHWPAIGGGLVLLEPLWRAIRAILELSGNTAFLGEKIANPQAMGAVIAVLLDPPGWSIALLIAVGLLFFGLDAPRWHRAPRQVAPFGRRPLIGIVRKGAIERGNVVRRAQSGAQLSNSAAYRNQISAGASCCLAPKRFAPPAPTRQVSLFRQPPAFSRDGTCWETTLDFDTADNRVLPNRRTV